MEFSKEHSFPTIDDNIPPHGLNSNWFCSSPQKTYDTDQIMDVSALEPDFFEFDWAPPFPYQSKQLCFSEFPELENFSFNDFDLPPLDENFVVDQKSLSIVLPTTEGFNNDLGEASMKIESRSLTCIKQETEEQIQEVPRSGCRKKRTSELGFDEIKKHFDVPITEAAKEMNVGLTLLKRRCRELNIMRWPHRKIKSLKLLIDNVKEMGLSNEVAMLEEHQKMLEKLPGMELTEETKKLRQACFKANYKRRRYLALQA